MLSVHRTVQIVIDGYLTNWPTFAEFYKSHVVLQLQSGDHVEKLCSGVQQLQTQVRVYVTWNQVAIT